MLINVNRETGDPEKVLAAIRDYDPDFVVLEEIDQKWFDLLAPALAEKYPHHEEDLRDDNFGIGLWSKHPFNFAAILSCGDHGIPTLLAEIEFPGHGPLNLIATHPLPPAGRA
jgi:endonuclease/exonuclease/phosphatase (EEP) superfamily protein YafD